MSPVSSMLPPPVHEPAMAANGWAASGLGNDAGTTGSLGMATGPSGCSARAVGTNTEMRRKAAKPRMMLGFIVTPLHAPCDIPWSRGAGFGFIPAPAPIQRHLIL